MKLKKLAIVICVMSMAMSTLMGIPVNASYSAEYGVDELAELPEAPKFSDLELTSIYTELFDSSDLSFAALDAGNWDFSRADYKNFSIRANVTAVSFAYDRWMQYTPASRADGLFYYRYKIRMYNETENQQVVNLVGQKGEYTLVASPNANNSSYDLITVVDTANSVAHTYDYKGNYLSSIDIGNDTITGIKFKQVQNENKNFYLYDFYYGTVADTTSTIKPTATPVPAIPEAPKFSDLKRTVVETELFDSVDFATLDAGSWDFSRTDYKNFTVRTSAVSFAWQRWMQYNQKAQADGLFYYQYKIKMYDETEDTQLVKLLGENGEYTVISSPDATGANYEYVTVVDTVNSVAYTYDYKGNYLSSISIGSDRIKGIKFENTENVSTNTFYIYDFYYGTIASDVQETVTFAEEVQFDPEATETTGTLRFKAAIKEKNFTAQEYGFKFVNFTNDNDSISNYPSYSGDTTGTVTKDFSGNIAVNDVFYHDITNIPKEADVNGNATAVTGVGFYAVPYVCGEDGQFYYGTPFTFEGTFNWSGKTTTETK